MKQPAQLRIFLNYTPLIVMEELRTKRTRRIFRLVNICFSAWYRPISFSFRAQDVPRFLFYSFFPRFLQHPFSVRRQGETNLVNTIYKGCKTDFLRGEVARQSINGSSYLLELCLCFARRTGLVSASCGILSPVLNSCRVRALRSKNKTGARVIKIFCSTYIMKNLWGR